MGAGPAKGVMAKRATAFLEQRGGAGEATSSAGAERQARSTVLRQSEADPIKELTPWARPTQDNDTGRGASTTQCRMRRNLSRVGHGDAARPSARGREGGRRWSTQANHLSTASSEVERPYGGAWAGLSVHFGERLGLPTKHDGEV